MVSQNPPTQHHLHPRPICRLHLQHRLHHYLGPCRQRERPVCGRGSDRHFGSETGAVDCPLLGPLSGLDTARREAVRGCWLRNADDRLNGETLSKLRRVAEKSCAANPTTPGSSGPTRASTARSWSGRSTRGPWIWRSDDRRSWVISISLPRLSGKSCRSGTAGGFR